MLSKAKIYVGVNHLQKLSGHQSVLRFFGDDFLSVRCLDFQFILVHFDFRSVLHEREI